MGKLYNIKPDCFLEDGDLYVTSFFGKRTDPVTGAENVTHAGVDCVRNIGWNTLAGIAAMESGVVSGCHWGEKEGKEYSTARGNWVKIDHGNGIETLYQHLQDTSTVKKGDEVAKGQKIGHMGNTGKSAGAHLHIEVYVDGKVVDPLPYLLKEKAIKEATGEAYYIEINDTLSKGMKGEKVKALQKRISQISKSFENEIKSHSITANNELDGSFGAKMVDTIKRLQREAGVPETGVTDEATRKVLNSNILSLYKKITNAKNALE